MSDGVWLGMDTAPRDGTWILLRCVGGDFPTTEDSEWATIGFCDADNNESNEWHMAGWDWCHDRVCAGDGEPVAWAPMAETLT